MIESLLSLGLGGIARLAPEVLKLLDKKNERVHELALLDKNLEAEKSRAALVAAGHAAEYKQALNQSDVQALIEATKAQAQEASGTWAAGLSAMIRPFMAIQWVLLLWPATVISGFVLAVMQGVPALDAMAAAFGPAEHQLAQSIAAFWLVDRALRRVTK